METLFILAICSGLFAILALIAATFERIELDPNSEFIKWLEDR